MKLPKLTTLLAATLLGVVLAVPLLPPEEALVGHASLLVRMKSEAGGDAQVFFDSGHGLSEVESVRMAIGTSPGMHEYPFAIPRGIYRAFRFDPLASDDPVEIERLRIVDSSGALLRDIPLESLQPAHDIKSADITDGVLRMVPNAGAVDPQFAILFSPGLDTFHLVNRWYWVGPFLLRAIPFTLAIILVLLAMDNLPAATRLKIGFAQWTNGHASRAVALVALIATVASAYPIVFMGRSYVSPNFADGTFLLYDHFPTLPGYDDSETESASGSDVGAMAWSHVPLSMAQHEAIFQHGELPLWNRYNSAGTVLLAQGQSTFGDPFQIPVVAANGAAWAWDAKYVFAKWLFAAGLALIVLRMTGHLPAALLTAVAAPFIGFFLFRVNHPAYFSMCYSPWILYAWVRIMQANGWRDAVRWLGLLVLANWSEMNSGTAKEAYMLLLGLNATGAVALLMSECPLATKIAKMAAAATAGLLFAGMSMPIWDTFFEALGHSYTSYNLPHTFQIDPSFLAGLFDEIFYRPIHDNEWVLNPSANFLVLGGVLFVLATLRSTMRDRGALAIGICAVVPLALAFGLVPPGWILAIPFLANVAHVDNTFSCILIVQLTVLAGFGLRAAARRLGTPDGRGDLTIAGILLVTLLFPFIAILHTVHRAPFGRGTVYTPHEPGEFIAVSGFVWTYIASILGALLLLGFVAHLMARRKHWSPAGALLAAACVATLLWRHGAHGRNAFDNFTYNPATRVDFHASSPAVEFARSIAPEPGRTVGLGGILFPGWGPGARLEGISGPDALMNPAYRELLEVCRFERIWNWRIYVTPQSVPAMQRAYDFLNVRCFLGPRQSKPALPTPLRRIEQPDLDVFVSDTAWPRAFFTDRVSTYSDAAAFGAMVLEGDGRPFAAMSAQDPAAGLSPEQDTRTIVPARDYVMTSNRTSFQIDAPGPGLAVLTEVYWPRSTHVRVDGRRAHVIRVNHAFRGVMVPPGRHTIEFNYWPPHLTLALVVAGVSFGIFATLLWRFRRGVPMVPGANTATPLQA